MSAIALYARALPGHTERVAATVQRLRDAAARHPGRIVLASSLGAEDMVLTDLIARHRLPITIATLDTGRLHEQTLELLPRIRARYGLEVEVHRPQAAAVIEFVRREGEDAMFKSIAQRHACCELRKMQPLQRLLESRTAWVTGLRREQSQARADVPDSEVESATGREKFNPLADWRWADVWQHIATHEVPYNPLHDNFMPSIGCEPCTRAIAVGEPFRSGRWWWEQGGPRECGLHMPTTSHEPTEDEQRTPA
jgi:phosphoadenosine phosphosulfate reductase